MANLVLSVMGAIAEFERSLIRERQREGIALAKQRGAYKGRKRPSHRNGQPSWPGAPAPAFRKPSLPGTVGSAWRQSTSTCATPSWSEPLPCHAVDVPQSTRPRLTERRLSALRPASQTRGNENSW
jgi:hypothetical protein